MSTLLAYVPFVDALPLYHAWVWLALPLVAGLSLVHKSVKCRHMRDVPREAAVIAFWILVGLVGAAVTLSLITSLLER